MINFDGKNGVAQIEQNGTIIPGAIVPKGNGWYTVQIPLNKIETSNGSGKLSWVRFREDWVHNSLLVDSFRTISAQGYSAPGSIVEQQYRSKMSSMLNYLIGNETTTLRSGKVEDLDQNGVLNAIDMTILKRMMLSQ